VPGAKEAIVEFLKVVGDRRSIRWYKTWEVPPREKIQRILEAARMCTSPGNIQPWRAVVVYRDELPDDVRDELLKADNWQGGHTLAPVWIYWYADPMAAAPETFLKRTTELLQAEASPREWGWDESALKGAIEAGETMPEGTAPIHEWHNLPIEIATVFCMQETNGACVLAVLAAQNEGLATALHMAAKPSARGRVQELLGIPEYCALVWLQLLGYPAEDPGGGGQRPRVPFEELFFEGKVGTPFKRDDAVVEQLKEEGLIQLQAPAPWRRDEHRNLARMYGYPEL
jgi:nitroreductase